MNKTATHYVDNNKFLEVLLEYQKQLKEAKTNETEHPKIPEYVGECLFKIATHLAHRSNFSSYSYKNEFISDALENSIMYLNNFDPEKSRNPFAYFSQISFFSFIRRITREKKQTLIKNKIIQNMPFDVQSVQELDYNKYNEDGRYKQGYDDYFKTEQEINRMFPNSDAKVEKDITKKKPRKSKTPKIVKESLGSFMNEN